MTDGSPHEYKETPGSCVYCGNSPVGHFSTYCAYTLSVWTSRLTRRQGRRTALLADTLGSYFEHGLYRVLAALPFTRFSSETDGALTYRSQVIWEEARRRNIEMEQMLVFGKPTEIYRAKVAGKWAYFQSLPMPSRKAAPDYTWSDDKFLLKQVLREAGIPAPRSLSVASDRAAKQALRKLGAPLAFKPQAGSRGRHTTVNVRTAEDAVKAFRLARQLCRYVSAEEHLDGSVCRATVVGGTLAGFFQAHPPRIVGDGVSTVLELIRKANETRPERVQSVLLTEEHERFIERAGFGYGSILPLGHALALSHRTGRLFGGRTRELLGFEHPKLRDYVERAARILDAPIIGFDLIIADPTQDPDAQKWGIIEANTLPYIDLHYLPLEGVPTNVAADVWDLVERNAKAF